MRLDATGRIVARPTGGSFVVDIAALRDGTFALARSESAGGDGKVEPGRVLRLDRDDTITVLAGGGDGFEEGAKATDVDLGDVSAVASAANGALLIGDQRQ